MVLHLDMVLGVLSPWLEVIRSSSIGPGSFGLGALSMDHATYEKVPQGSVRSMSYDNHHIISGTKMLDLLILISSPIIFDELQQLIIPNLRLSSSHSPRNFLT